MLNLNPEVKERFYIRQWETGKYLAVVSATESNVFLHTIGNAMELEAYAEATAIITSLPQGTYAIDKFFIKA